jgi:hypothetical protein
MAERVSATNALLAQRAVSPIAMQPAAPKTLSRTTHVSGAWGLMVRVRDMQQQLATHKPHPLDVTMAL